MSKRLIIANWKMNPVSLREAEYLFKEFKKVTIKSKNIHTILCVPFPYLYPLKKLKTILRFLLGAQNVFKDVDGAYTGEVSPLMIADSGANFCIVGHSERRAMGETDVDINQKIKLLLKNKISPILCVGERERDGKHTYFDFVKRQIVEDLKNVQKNLLKNIVIAYEPVWAIGKDATREATPVEVNEMTIFIRKCISDISSSSIAHDIKVIYGGSVTKNNVSDFIEYGGVDGFLVGRASLSVRDFIKIIQIVDKK